MDDTVNRAQRGPGAAAPLDVASCAAAASSAAPTDVPTRRESSTVVTAAGLLAAYGENHVPRVWTTMATGR